MVGGKECLERSRLALHALLQEVHFGNDASKVVFADLLFDDVNFRAVHELLDELNLVFGILDLHQISVNGVVELLHIRQQVHELVEVEAHRLTQIQLDFVQIDLQELLVLEIVEQFLAVPELIGFRREKLFGDFDLCGLLRLQADLAHLLVDQR